MVLSVTLPTHSRLPLWLAVPVELGAALLVAIAFYWVVERPTHRLARALRRPNR